MNKTLSFKIKAELPEIEVALDKILAVLEELNADHKTAYKVRLALDELLTNVVSYAYEYKEGGEIEISYKIADDPRSITLSIADEGKAFNPLETEDPDLALDVSERKIGGLGIFLVKNVMDEIDYRRENERNILTIKKNI